jgi:hypothetical protein
VKIISTPIVEPSDPLLTSRGLILSNVTRQATSSSESAIRRRSHFFTSLQGGENYET